MQTSHTGLPTTSETGTRSTTSIPSKPELAHSPLFLGNGLVILPSGFLSAACNTASSKSKSRHGTKMHGLKHYEEAYKVHDYKKQRQTFCLAQATRRSLELEKQLALQRVYEGKILLDLLQSEAQLAQLKVDEADLEIGMMRAVFEPQAVEHESDDDLFSTNHTSNPLSESESESESDLEREQEYFDLAIGPESQALTKSQALTEEALHWLDNSLQE